MQLNKLTRLPLSTSQMRLWTIWKLDNNNPAYNLSFTYCIEGRIDINLFEKSIEILFKRHIIVFATIKETNLEPWIDITPVPVRLSLTDLGGTSPKDESNIVFPHIEKAKRKVFDLQTGPLYRLHLFRFSEARSYFHVTFHNIIFDGYSWKVFVNELNIIYNNLLTSNKKLAEILEVLNYEKSLFEPNQDIGENKEELLKFWREFLTDSPTGLPLQPDFPRKGKHSGLGENIGIMIPASITGKLKSICTEQRLSMFKLILSSLGILFHRYTDQKDLSIGTFASNKQKETREALFGMFVDTIPVKFTIEGNLSFADYLNHSKQLIDDAIAHKDLSFDKIVESVNPERVSNINPLFQVALSWWSGLLNPMELGDARGEWVTVPKGVSPFDITFYLWERSDLIEGFIEFNVDIFDPGTIARLRDHFLLLLRNIAEDKTKPVSDLSLISENDKKKLQKFNDTKSSIPELLIHELFENQSELRPDKTAVISGANILTYKELDSRANQLARHLIANGVTNGEIAGIFLERSADMLISVLAVLKSGCSYLPMDTTYPAERTDFMINDSGVKIIISQSSLKEQLPLSNNIPLLWLDVEQETINKQSPEKPLINIYSQSLAYLIYTSGSTGKPKGVKTRHESVVNLINSMSKIPGISENDKLLAVVTLAFDMSVYELFVPLANGATVVIADSQDTYDGPSLIKLINSHNITLLQATPSFWSILLSAGWEGKKDLKALIGGEALTNIMAKNLVPKVSELWNCYGPTETTVYATCMRVLDPDDKILIGKPIDNTTIYILDKYRNNRPVGIPGEVCIGGSGVSEGYINRPELTGEKFISFSENQILYKTGDLGRYRDDGNIELFGRIDHQIKLRGYRIEPGEIEAHLIRLNGVQEAVVNIQRFEGDDERLVAFLRVDDTFTLTRTGISENLSNYLPVYMIPSFYKVSDSFPRLPNGKTDRNSLNYNVEDVGHNQEKETRKITGTEKVLISIWEEVLKTNRFAITDNFFNVGGNSLLALTVYSKIKQILKIEPELRVIFDNPRITDLAKYIDFFMRGKDINKNRSVTPKSNNTIITGEL